jgi:enoyl-CoA hydratase/carnithine racemase
LDVPEPAGFTATIAGEVATITLDRPERLNSQTPHTWTALVDVAAQLPGSVRVVVLRGSGRAFSAGLDRSMFAPEGIDGVPGVTALAGGPVEAASAQIGAWQRAFDWTSRHDLVSIAAVHGHAIGGGFQLALGTDLRIIADDTQFCMAEPKLGLVPDLGGTKRLVELVGYSRAAEICLTGRRVGAEEALRIGLASAVVPAAELDTAVASTVAAILAIDRDAAAETKALLKSAQRNTQAEQQLAETQAQYRRLRALSGLDSAG